MLALSLLLMGILVLLLSFEWHRNCKENKRLRKDLSELMRQIPQAGTSIPMSHFRQISAEKDVAINELSQSLATTEKALAELKSQQQSKSVRLGQISEHSVGLLPNFPFDIKEMRFLGSPIDYMAFDFDKEIIYFVEVKTGKSKLSERQKTIKRIVEAGNVKFTQIKITETGIEYEDDGNNIM